MRNASELMVQYARYHRDRRNITTHFVGVPLIVLGIGVLLAHPVVPVGGVALTPAWLLWLVSTAWYLTRGKPLLGAATVAVNALLFLLAHQMSGGPVAHWLGWGLGAFVVGWVIQFIGHWYEGRKPAFVDDIVGLVVAPMFITGEALFAFGFCRPLLDEIEAQAGPTVLRDLAHPLL